MTPADAERTKRIMAAGESGEKNDARDVRNVVKRDAKTDARTDARNGAKREEKADALTVLTIP